MAIDTSVYERKRRDINQDYTTQSATNAYSRFLSQQRGQRNIADYTRQYGRQSEDLNRAYGRNTADYTQNYQRGAPKLTAAYGNRGLATGGVQSGVYGKAMQNYVGDYNQQMGRATEDYTTGSGRIAEDQALATSRYGEDVTNDTRQYDLSQAQLTSARDRALSDMEIDKAKEIANAALYLSALKPQFGG
jgi:hypothetical protein